MAKTNQLKAQMLEAMLDAGCIVPGPIFGKDGFISPSNPSAKIALNSAQFLQLLPQAVKRLIPDASGIDIVCGIETSGIPVAALVAYALKKPFAYVRKKPKPYGRGLAIQGGVSGKRVLLVDDLLFYGETKDDAINKIHQAQGHLVGTFVIVTMDPQSAAWAAKHKITLLRLFDRDELYRDAAARGMISRELYEFEQALYGRRDWLYWHTDKKLWQRYCEIMKTDPLFHHL
ncbi:hypothetical protein HY065_03115 [Candidatus Berkelbacteria bacterium]|nr:hypothetical protein [Candidatus Berkelbacteria bacterium]